MAIAPNRRQRVIEFSTPKISDLVIVEVHDSSRNVGSADTATGRNADGTVHNYGDFHPNASKYPGFKLALIKNADDKQGQFQSWYYIKDRAEQDKYNWEFQAAGGSSPLYDTIVKTYVLPRYGSGASGAPGSTFVEEAGKMVETSTDQEAGVDYFDEALPVINSTMPSTVHDPFGGGLGSDTTPDTSYVLFEKKQVRSGDETLDSLYVVEQRIYVKKVPIRRTDVDAEFDISLKSKETLWYKDETIYKTTAFKKSTTTGDDDARVSMSATTEAVFTRNEVPDDFFGTFTHTNSEDSQSGADSREVGILREGRQLSNNWYAVAEREIIKYSTTTKLVRSYTTYQNYTWPAVLSRIANEKWTRRDGGADTIVYPIYKRGAYSGPTKVLVELFWKDSEFDVANPASKTGSITELATINPMLPEPMVFQTPIASVNVPPTLHELTLVVATTGSNHPVYSYAGTRWLFSATNYTDWPTSLVIADSQRPYKGGYLRERITAYRPEAAT